MNAAAVTRFAELLTAQGVHCEIADGILWREYNRMIVPVGPIKPGFSLRPEAADRLLSRFVKAFLVRWTDRLEQSPACTSENDWYAVICDAFRDLDALSANTRSKVRRGLKECRIERVDARYIADHGFGVFIAAYGRYKGVKPPGITEREFSDETARTIPFDDIIHYWAGFHENKMIAYSKNYIYDGTEADYSTIKFHPEYLKFYPSYALLYEMNKCYLKERGFDLVNDGFRSILHQTNIQNFLIDTFHFYKCRAPLTIVYRPLVSAALSVTFPMRRHLRRVSPSLASLYKLEEIRKWQGVSGGARASELIDTVAAP